MVYIVQRLFGISPITKAFLVSGFTAILVMYGLARDLQHILPNTLKQRASSGSVRGEQIEQL